MRLSPRVIGPLLITLCASFLIAQVLVRPAIGIANNGDFAKMAGPLGLGPEDGDWLSHKEFSEFLYSYMRNDRYSYNRGFQSAEFLSSEFLLVKLARGIQRIIEPGARFDIRWLGGLSGTFFLVSIGVWIYAFSGRWRLYAGLLLILIWTDVAYVQYLNSFYMDTAAMIFLVLCVGAGVHVVTGNTGRMFPVLMVLAATLFAGSKSQHTLPGLLFIPLFLNLAFWSRDRMARVAWVTGSVLLVLVVFVMLGRNTVQWRSTNVYNQVFWLIAPASPDPLRTLEELGLGGNELPYVHTFAFSPNSPMSDPDWVRQFALRCNYATLFRYYLHHPLVAAHFLYQNLSTYAANMRPYGNRSADDGFKPFTQATTFTYWTNFRSLLLAHAPWHIILLTFCVIAGAVWLFWRDPTQRPFVALVLTAEAVAATEYGVSILADAVETARHLFVFHVATEASILLFVLLLWRIYQWRRSRTFSIQQID